MYELMEQYGGALVAALVAAFMFATLGRGLPDAFFEAGSTYNAAAAEDDSIDKAVAAVESVTSKVPPETAAETIRAGKDYTPDQLISHIDGHVTVIDIEGDAPVDLGDGSRYIRFGRKGIYRMRYTIVGSAGGEKTRNIYLNVTD